MIKVTLPDGSQRACPKGTKAVEVAKGISEGLARHVISAERDGQPIEVTAPLERDCKLVFYTWNDDEGKKVFWHSSAHLLAQAIEFYYPKVKLTIGPAVENGFYYDVDLGEDVISEKDFPKIEKKMLEFAREKATFELYKVSKSEALDKYRDNEYKTELIGNLEEGDITFCSHSNFTDLCRGGPFASYWICKSCKNN